MQKIKYPDKLQAFRSHVRILQGVLLYIAMFGEIIYRQLVFLDGHIDLTNKVPSTFSGVRVSLQWKPAYTFHYLSTF